MREALAQALSCLSFVGPVLSWVSGIMQNAFELFAKLFQALVYVAKAVGILAVFLAAWQH